MTLATRNTLTTVRLTERQALILRRFLAGMTVTEIAYREDREPITIRQMLKTLCHRFNVTTLDELSEAAQTRPWERVRAGDTGERKPVVLSTTKDMKR